MKRIFISAALASMVFAGCQDDLLVKDREGDKKGVFTLEVDNGAASRTAMGEETRWKGAVTTRSS